MGSLIPKGSRVLLDTVALIYFLEGHERYAKPAEAMFARIEAGELQGILASLAFTELLVPLYRAGDTQVAAGLTRRLRNFRHLEVVDLTPEIAMEAARLRADHGLRTPDAIHGATALLSRANGILTNDQRLKVLSQEGLSVWLFDALI